MERRNWNAYLVGYKRSKYNGSTRQYKYRADTNTSFSELLTCDAARGWAGETSRKRPGQLDDGEAANVGSPPITDQIRRLSSRVWQSDGLFSIHGKSMMHQNFRSICSRLPYSIAFS
ncbi:hypothetical protein SCLCIDRAFT_192604 [Scleroderma citrinum Foug A]|uniref:Uncharacterized protein n=1 Tax=Scleroderma citrinum Foug A TaxID=1036808 RepID=A0A0C2Z4U8_9AGAM|nr:hypothetical protein SCLCIDRAFT_192604 [Scleroderma citrinum Foug A]